MTIPETTETAAAAPAKSNSKLALAWMIVAQVISVLVILLAIGFGIFASLIGGGGLTGGNWNYIEVGLFLSPLLLVPIVASWVVYKKGKATTALILTTATFVLLFCPCAVAVVVIAFSS